MKYYVVNLLLLLSIATISYSQKGEWKEAKSGEYTYRYVSNDPIKVRFYTLKNGLTVALSPNKKEPRVAVKIAVRTGSNNDPKDHTGLAHYLEHLLFKGTDKFGSLNYTKEKKYLDQVVDLYEVYNATTDAAKRKEVYKKIDSISGLSAKQAIAGEYDQLMSMIGSQNTNAHTWVEETIYQEDIPSNAMDHFLAIQSERFKNPVFRGFHTELETVYEEKNRGLDNDEWKVSEAMHALIFPTHNYGLQTTIGTIEHLKNPSIKAIREYYNKYYVPNNMAIVMAGDFDPDVLIKKIDAAFAYMKPGNPTPYKGPEQSAINGPVIKDVFGPLEESVNIGYRVGSAYSRDALLADLCTHILNNGKAGLLDLNLNKTQKVLSCNAGVRQYIDYGLFMLSGTPKKGQSLEQVKDLLLGEVDKLKKGEFEESLIKAIVANGRFDEMHKFEQSEARAEAIASAFILSSAKDWDKEVNQLYETEQVSKKEITGFANRFFTNTNYVVVNKKMGEDKNVTGVEKPTITPIETNSGANSPFVQALMQKPISPVKPVWVDFNKDIQKSKTGNAEIVSYKNVVNEIFNLNYYFKMGDFNNKLLPVALSYLEYLGTSKYSAEQISKEFYGIASSFKVVSSNDEMFVNINGLQNHFNKAVSLFDHLIRECRPDEKALEALKESLLKTRANDKTNKENISEAMLNYASYGPSNPFNYTLSDKEIRDIRSEQLISILHGLMDYEHQVLYYGPASKETITVAINENHKLPAQWATMPVAVKFQRLKQDKNRVLFTDYDMVQAEVFWQRNLQPYNPMSEAINRLFNSVFGDGMGSVVFQTLRESRALAYSTFASINAPQKKNDVFTFVGYIGTQADKMNEAIKGMNSLIKAMPQDAAQQVPYVKENMLSEIETQRLTGPEVLQTYIAAKRKGIDYDLRKIVYEQLKKLAWANVLAYHKQQLPGKPYTYSIIASDKNIKIDSLKKLGEVKKLSLQELFGY